MFKNLTKKMDYSLNGIINDGGILNDFRTRQSRIITKY